MEMVGWCWLPRTSEVGLKLGREEDRDGRGREKERRSGFQVKRKTHSSIDKKVLTRIKDVI